MDPRGEGERAAGRHGDHELPAPGLNKLVLAPTRSDPGRAASSSKDVALKVVIGEGNVGGDHVMIDNPLVETTRTAAEIEDRTEEYVLEAR